MVVVPVLTQRLTTGTGQRYDPETETILPVSTFSCGGNVPVALQPIATHDVAGTMLSRNTSGGFSNSIDHASAGYMALQPIALQDVRAVEKNQGGKGWNDDGTAYTIDTWATQGMAQPIPIDSMQITAPTLTSNGDAHSGYRDEHGLVPMAFAQNQRDEVRLMAIAGALAAQPGMKQQTYLMQPVAFDWQSGGDSRGLDPKSTAQLQRCQTPAIMQAMAVRRLTPVECERLQGFPDGYTDIQPKGKATPDGPRYKALGNSMAVPVMRWIGERIAQVEAIHAP
jgi:site-specific DNA-cytosine methylase